MKNEMKTGIMCTCGTFTKYPRYILKHWYGEAEFTCDECTEKIILKEGQTLSKYSKEEVNEE